MKKIALLIACLALPCAAAQAQTTQHYQFPAAPGSLSPPSTLTIIQESAGGPPAGTGVVIHDTPESAAEYQRCRTVSDRAAITNADRQNGVMQCLKALQERRQQGAVLQ